MKPAALVLILNLVTSIWVNSALSGEFLFTKEHQGIHAAGQIQWKIYDNRSGNAAIEQTFSEKRKGPLLSLRGGGDDGFEFLDRTGGPLTEAEHAVVEWTMSSDDPDFYVYIGVHTDRGYNYLTYRPFEKTHNVVSGHYLSLGLGQEACQGEWQTFRRDLLKDYRQFFPETVAILKIRKFLFRGEGVFHPMIKTAVDFPALPSDFLLPDKHLNGASTVPETYHRYFVSNDGMDAPGRGETPETPIKTLAYAKALIHQKEQGEAATGYGILLKRGDHFTPANYFVADASKGETTSETLYGRSALLWNTNKPLWLSSYGASGERPVLDGNCGTIRKEDSSGDRVKTARVQVAIHLSCGQHGSRDQKTIIENIHFKHWQMAAVYSYRHGAATLRNCVIEKSGTFYSEGEEYRLENGEPLYSGGVLLAHRCGDMTIRNNVIIHGHNLDRLGYPAVDKYHPFYGIHPLGKVDFSSNLVRNVSGCISLKGGQGLSFIDNRFEHVGLMRFDVQQEGKGYFEHQKLGSGHLDDGLSYVQLGFIRITVPLDSRFETDTARDVLFKGNKFYCPFSWARFSGKPQLREGIPKKFSGKIFEPTAAPFRADRPGIGYKDRDTEVFYPYLTLASSCQDDSLEAALYEKTILLNGSLRSKMDLARHIRFDRNRWCLHDARIGP